MKVSIIGTGNMAKGIGTRLVAGGHEVTFHAKDESKGKVLADELSKTGKANVVAVGTTADDVVVLATPYTEVATIAKQYDGFAGKTVVDITNPVDFNTFQLIPDRTTSGAEEIAKLIPNAKVVKAFNTTLAGVLVAGKVDGKVLDVFVAGDDAEAKKNVCELINSSDMRAIDVGPLANARHLEGFGLIQMQIQDQIGTGWMSALKFIS